jgi:hypothetical protein
MAAAFRIGNLTAPRLRLVIVQPAMAGRALLLECPPPPAPRGSLRAGNREGFNSVAFPGGHDLLYVEWRHSNQSVPLAEQEIRARHLTLLLSTDALALE